MSEPTPKNKSALTGFGTRNRSVFVWICRIVLGLTFIVSGLSKMIDIWGFMYKIDQYLNVWGCPQPQSLVFTCAAALSTGRLCSTILPLSIRFPTVDASVSSSR